MLIQPHVLEQYKSGSPSQMDCELDWQTYVGIGEAGYKKRRREA